MLKIATCGYYSREDTIEGFTVWVMPPTDIHTHWFHRIDVRYHKQKHTGLGIWTNKSKYRVVYPYAYCRIERWIFKHDNLLLVLMYICHIHHYHVHQVIFPQNLLINACNYLQLHVSSFNFIKTYFQSLSNFQSFD